MYQGTQPIPFAKHPLRLYILGGIVAIIVSTVVIMHPVWIKYCAFEFGLSDVSLIDGEKIGAGIYSIRDMKEEFCIYKGTEDIKKDACPHFCDTIKDFQKAGEVMMWCGVFGIVLVAIAVLLHILAYRDPQFSWRTVTAVTLLAYTAWTLSFIVYCCIADFASVKKTEKDYGFHYWKLVDLKMEAGFIVAAIETVYMQILTAMGLHGLWKIRHFKQDPMVPLTET